MKHWPRFSLDYAPGQEAIATAVREREDRAAFFLELEKRYTRWLVEMAWRGLNPEYRDTLGPITLDVVRSLPHCSNGWGCPDATKIDVDSE